MRIEGRHRTHCMSASPYGFAVMAEEVARMREAAAARQSPHDTESWNNLFGNKQFEKR